ncbi:MAG: helix-turn-helix transcriptional regulator [Eggerthellaceae bacterium]|nr:helix-turn-helix transcriptional regulator [Eggerthellaceae bacterium]
MVAKKKKDEKKQMAARLAHEERMALPLAKLAGMREARGWSKAKSADAAGMDPTTYSRIERCVVNPFPAQAEAIADAFGVSVDDLAAPAPEAVAAEETALALPESVDPIVELGQRVKALEDEMAAVMESLGAQKAKVDAMEDKDFEPVVLDRNGLPMRAGMWYMDCNEQVPAKAAPRYIESVELHEVEGKGLLAYFPNGIGQFGIAAVDGGRCPNLAVVDIVERGRKDAR